MKKCETCGQETFRGNPVVTAEYLEGLLKMWEPKLWRIAAAAREAKARAEAIRDDAGAADCWLVPAEAMDKLRAALEALDS